MIENIQVFTQNSIRIDSRFGPIYIDPIEMEDEPHDATYIFITHDHYDHFSPKDIKRIANQNTILIVPEKMAGKADELSGSVGKIDTVKPEIYREINGLEFETVKAYNVIKFFHPKSAEWVGYILRIDGKRIYIAGDTDLTKEAKAVKCDIALVPIGGTYTMNPKKAADLINTIRPEIAIPVHYGTIVGKPEDEDEFKKYAMHTIKVVPKISFD